MRAEPPTPVTWLRQTMEPEVSRRRALLAQLGFLPAPSDIQPRRTRCIDLLRDPELILSDMTGTNRTLYRSTTKRGLAIETSHRPADLIHLTRLIDQTSAHRGFKPQAHTQLEELAGATLPLKQSTLFLARHEGQVISAILAVDGGGSRILAHGAAERSFSKLRAQQSLVITAVMDARQRGLRLADLYGIAPTDDPQHPWSGFSRFKASFGGHVVEHIGAWDLPVRPLAYRSLQAGRGLYRLSRSIR